MCSKFTIRSDYCRFGEKNPEISSRNIGGKASPLHYHIDFARKKKAPDQSGPLSKTDLGKSTK
jgi:hypothetical protein